MKKLMVLVVLALCLSGCGILHKNQGVVGKASVAEDRARVKIEQVEGNLNLRNFDRLKEIGEFSYGVGYTLKQTTTNKNDIAETLNTRIQSLAEKPSLDAIKEIQVIVNDLMTNNTATLERKDKEISHLQQNIEDLKVDKQKAMDNYIRIADKTAALEDQYKATLNQMDRFGGLGAIWYGIKKLVIRLAWVLGIGSVLFLVLRIASMSNPIAASVFAIFNQVGSWVVHGVQVLFPKAVELAGHTATEVFNLYKSTLTKIVDAVQTAKTSGKPLETALDEMAKTMNEDEKTIVTEIKKLLNWKQ